MDILPPRTCLAERNLKFWLPGYICLLLKLEPGFLLGKVLESIPKEVSSIIWHSYIILASWSTGHIIADLLINFFPADGETRHREVRINWPYKLMAVRNMNQYLLASRVQVFANCAPVAIWAYLVSRARPLRVCLLPRGAVFCLLGESSSLAQPLPYTGPLHSLKDSFFTYQKTLTVDFSRLQFEFLSSHNWQKPCRSAPQQLGLLMHFNLQSL